MSVFPDDIFSADPLAAVIEEKTLQLKEGERRICWHAKTDVGKIILNTYMI